MIYNEQIISEIKSLEKSIADKKAYISAAPAGRLECHKSHNTFIWRVITKDEQGKKKRKYIKRADIRTAKMMALKGLYKCELYDEEQELHALQTYLKKRSEFKRGEQYLTKSEYYYNLLSDHINSTYSEDIMVWINDISDELAPHQEKRTKRCINGLMVRSKSEQSIVKSLVEKKIPFKYEQPLQVGSKRYFPDFTIMNPRTKDIFYWEHFGMMDDVDYANNTFEKLNNYNRNGYMPLNNLIISFENFDNGIDDQWLDTIIELYLL